MRFLFLLFLLMILPFFLISETIQYKEITIEFPTDYAKFTQKMIKPFYQNIARFQKKISKYIDLPVNIVIIEDDKDYLKYINSKQEIIEFSDAFYTMKNQTIYLRDPKRNIRFVRLQQILLHEYIHHFVYHFFSNAPLWFHEGMAVYYSEGISEKREMQFVFDRISGDSIPLKKMKYQYPSKQLRWNSFYAKSALAVRYLSSKKKTAFYRFWEQADQLENFDLFFLNSFFQTQDDFSIEFEEFATHHYYMLLTLALSSLIWAGLPILFFIALIRRKFKENKIKKRWLQFEECNERI